MAALFALVLAGLGLHARAALIEPSLQAVIWKYNGTDFWSPVHLDQTVYHIQSPTGALPSSLQRRGLPSGGHMACTVVTLNSSVTSLSSDVLADIISGYAIDDVWSAEQFLDCLFIQYAGSATQLPIDASFADFVTKHGVSTSFLSTAFKLEGTSLPSTASAYSVVSACDLVNGPYVATPPSCEGGGLSLTPVYALHADEYEAFMEGVIPDATEQAKYQALHVSLPGARLPYILVPSRLAATMPGAGPLAGLRFGVKDIFHVEGLKTSGGSRAYYETYGYQNWTTETAELTIDGGASLVGKTKTIAFALGTPLNGNEIDYQDPWNARGDGYQSTGGSSSGSGAAVTAYHWVDFALGSDTGGSVRFPARFGGLYGYKSTWGIWNTTGILVAIAEQDTPGFLARSPEIFTRVGKVWANGKPLSPLPASLPTKMLRYADQQTVITQPAAGELIEAFFSKMASAFNLSTSSVNMTKSFLEANVSASNPPQTPAAFMPDVYADLNDVEGWDQLGKPLFDAYAQIPGHIGAFPPIDPIVNASWWDGQNETTRANYPESLRRKGVFGKWYTESVLPANADTCSEYIFAHTYHVPPSLTKVTPRAAVTQRQRGWYDGIYTNYAGTPEIVVPVGQVQYWSPYTRRDEWQPVTVALSVAKGCDLVLFDLVDRLAELGLLKEVLPGVVAYPVDST